ncbi:MAG TPA: DUF4097 family beta strand repeat-containing protein [Fodinibius sp.]|nr:DUF4097 family beta strand repeat-containing protein [Fodinibius sp.]
MDYLITFFRIRRFSFIILLALLMTIVASVPVTAQQTFQDEDPYRTESFTLSEGGALNVQTSGGHITVKGAEGNNLRVEMYVHKNGRMLSPADTDLSEWEIEISQSGQQVKAIAKRNNSGWNLFGGSNQQSISFVIYAPRKINTELSTSGGHISIQKLVGNQQLKTSGGHLNISQVKGTVDASTSGGHINVDGSSGELMLKTSGGHITLADVGGVIEAKTSGGNISADLNTIDEHAKLKTSGGNIAITIPENTGLDLDLKGSYVNASLDNFSGTTDRNEVEGELNGGGPGLSAKTSGGVVTLSFK